MPKIAAKMAVYLGSLTVDTALSCQNVAVKRLSNFAISVVIKVFLSQADPYGPRNPLQYLLPHVENWK